MDRWSDGGRDARGKDRGVRSGKPLCWYGSSCRRLHNPEHCSKYDHQSRPCKFGEKCRRKGRGCKYQHEGDESQDAPLLHCVEVSNHQDNAMDFDELDPERLVPFFFLLIGVCALFLLLLPFFGKCKTSGHEQMFYVGLALTTPLVFFEVLLFVKRSYVLEKFFAGDYSEQATFRELGLLWYPVPLQILRYTSGDVAGNNIEQYATWETNDLQEQVEGVTGGNRDGGQVRATVVPMYFMLNFPGAFASPSATIDANGNVKGMGVPIRFDGSNVVSQGGAWAKAGYWRLDVVTKVLLLLFVMGLECVFVAVEMPPGVSGVTKHRRMPLKAAFVVDGSSSISAEMWREQQGAGEEFIHALNRTYGGRPGDLNIGVVQFSTDAQVALPVSSDVDAALATLGSMPQMQGETYYNRGLRSCRTCLDAYKPEVESFEVCVLITDGIDMSEKTSQQLQDDAGPDTAIFGIYVGTNAKGQNLLQHLVFCGKAKHGKKRCNFFASAQDYAALSAEADDVAEQITAGVDLAMCAMVSALIGIPTALALCLPYILFYASCTGITLWKRHNEGNNYRNLNQKSLNNFTGNDFAT